MELTREQIEAFKDIHNGALDGLSEAEIKKMANGVAGFYLDLFRIEQRVEAEKNEYDNKTNSK